MDQNEERCLLHLYQSFKSLQDSIYPLFESKYTGRIHQKSYGNEDLLQEMRLALHLTMLSFDVWNKDMSFFKMLCFNTQTATKAFDQIHGYQYWGLRQRGLSPIHIPLDKNYPHNGRYGDIKDANEVGSEIAEALRDKSPNAEEILEYLQQFKSSMEILKADSPAIGLLLEFAEMEVPRQSKREVFNPQINALAWKYKHVIAPKSKWKPDKDRSQLLFTYIKNEVNRLRKLAGNEPISYVFNRLARQNDPSVMKRYLQDYYQANKERQSLYYKRYNAARKKK